MGSIVTQFPRRAVHGHGGVRRPVGTFGATWADMTPGYALPRGMRCGGSIPELRLGLDDAG